MYSHFFFLGKKWILKKCYLLYSSVPDFLLHPSCSWLADEGLKRNVCERMWLQEVIGEGANSSLI